MGEWAPAVGVIGLAVVIGATLVLSGPVGKALGEWIRGWSRTDEQWMAMKAAKHGVVLEVIRSGCSPKSRSSSVGWGGRRAARLTERLLAKDRDPNGSRGALEDMEDFLASSSFSVAAPASRCPSRRSAARWPTGSAARVRRPVAPRYAPSSPNTRKRSTRSSRRCGARWRSSPSAMDFAERLLAKNREVSGSDRVNERRREEAMEVLIPIIAVGGSSGP